MSTADLIEAHLSWLRPSRSTLTVSDRRRTLQHADTHLPSGLQALAEPELAEYLGNQAWSAWTRYTYDSHLRGFYTWAAARGHYRANPMAGMPKPPKGPQIPAPCSDEQLALAMTAPAFPWRRAVMLAAYAGLRCCEIATVTSGDLVDGRLRVHGKGRKVRMVPLAPVLLAELAGVVGPLCPGARGRSLTAAVLSKDQSDVWRRLGLPAGFTMHKMRHWFATRLLETGVDVRVVQVLMGHSSLTSTEGYLAVTDARTAAAVQRLPEVTAHEPTTTHFVVRAYDRPMASSRRTPDPQRIAVAQISGTIERCVVAHGITEDQALVDIGAALGPIAEFGRPHVLAEAAASYVDSDQAWERSALQLLVRAGADVDEARRRRDARPKGGYSGRFTH